MPQPRSTYRIEALGKKHERGNFACGAAPLERYLQQQARQDAEKHVAAPFVLLEPPSQDVLGYYTLSADSVLANELPAAYAKKLPRYPRLPVSLLGRLAVHERLKGNGFGQFLLMDALYRSLGAAAEIAAMAVIVDAKDENAARFYRHFQFMPLQEQPRRLFLPMRTIELLFT